MQCYTADMIETRKPLDKIVQSEAVVAQKLAQTKQSVFERFPLVFTLLGAFGLVATFYGFEGIIDSIDILSNHPVLLLAIGVITLLFTGTLYKRLG